MSYDQEKIKIAREYFMRADQGRPDILELFQEDAEVEMVAYRACTSISIPIIRVRMRRDFDGVGTISGESDDHPSGDDSWAR
jgi:hypothetical protein